ncbi:MAG: hypothetical protein HC896_02845 [Bacteroidales bacterium]|nr:hypothetical protein [Bacteroidales bacterium]
MFNDYVAIDEAFLARKAGVNGDTIYNYLKKLASLKIIKYIPSKNMPMLLFAEVRLDEKAVRLSPDNYRNRKALYEGRMQAMLQYTQADIVCRSMHVQTYFGEKAEQPCGRCDLCLKKHQCGLNNHEFIAFKQEILKVLHQGELPLLELLKK